MSQRYDLQKKINILIPFWGVRRRPPPLDGASAEKQHFAADIRLIWTKTTPQDHSVDSILQHQQ